MRRSFHRQPATHLSRIDDSYVSLCSLRSLVARRSSLVELPPIPHAMEKYSQFRDPGTGIAPFLPIPNPPAGILTPVHVLLFFLRVPFVLSLSLLYFGFLEFLPVGNTIKKCVLWVILTIPGVWWVDLQVDGVKRGKLAEKQNHLPHAGSIVAASFVSPLDPLYLAGIFTPVFTRSWAGEKKVEVITLFRAICLAFEKPQLEPPKTAKLFTLKELTEKNPDSIICVFPETTTTNGRGVLRFSPSLLTASPKTKIYPVHVKYSPGDITTPVPGTALSWIWRLLSKPTHCMRVRIARHMYNTTLDERVGKTTAADVDLGFDTNIFDSPHMRNGVGSVDEKDEKEGFEWLESVREDFARLGRVKRTALGVREKSEFVKVWGKRKR
ncbi:hypothetical protein P280DRAFT_474505 [Massarina eburnea CBS 473.64]|uniref:Phospholipid/glycerol acyltransferase domain-containing protein n=1 Tax=Massarina eburnea CBS 473.64 TaxID=1395130 RepID=A0A6A6RI09_9PLEO|nr:hypothetical protein P280DRAFT_474505 [Massarina eburnea CBS 473.64]